MEKIETCLGHIIGRCPHCTADDRNKECPDYKPATLITFEVAKQPRFMSEKYSN